MCSVLNVAFMLKCLFVFSFLFCLSSTILTRPNSLYFLKGQESGVRCFTGHDDDIESDLRLQKLPKKPKPTRVHRTDTDESESFDVFGGESKPGPSLLNQLLPGQAFDPRQIDFSALTLPNSHRSTKNKKR